MEENNDTPLSYQDLLNQLGPYDPKLDLSGYQYPALDLLPESLRSSFLGMQHDYSKYKMPLLLSGTGNVVVRDLYHHPNILLAGTIASGKTQFIYNQIITWLYNFHPTELKLVICRSKPVDYNSIAKIERHFLSKLPAEESPIAQGRQVLHTINSLIIECDQRLDSFQNAGVKTIEDYNDKFVNRALNPEQGHRYLSNIVLIMDDLQTFLNEETTNSLISLTQKNLYTGIYLIAATSQIMSRSITPQLRANFSVRLAMRLMSQNESRKILYRVGAEKLNPPGELLYEQGEKLVKGIQPFIDYATIQSICDFIGSQRGYPTAWLLPTYLEEPKALADFDIRDRDSMFEEAARLIVMHQQGSTSLIQRKLKLGYNRAGLIINQLEATGIVGLFEGSKPREVLFSDEYSLEQYLETLRNDDTTRIPIVSRSTKIDGDINKVQNKVSDSKQKTQVANENNFQTSASSPILIKGVSPSPPDNSSKVQAYIVVGILVAIVALIVFLMGGWEGLLKWLR